MPEQYRRGARDINARSRQGYDAVPAAEEGFAGTWGRALIPLAVVLAFGAVLTFGCQPEQSTEPPVTSAPQSPLTSR